RHDSRDESAQRTDVDSLARVDRSGRHGWRAGNQLSRHRAGHDVHLSLSREPGGHVLVSLALALPGTGGTVWTHRRGAEEWGAATRGARARVVAVRLDGP